MAGAAAGSICQLISFHFFFLWAACNLVSWQLLVELGSFGRAIFPRVIVGRLLMPHVARGCGKTTARQRKMAASETLTVALYPGADRQKKWKQQKSLRNVAYLHCVMENHPSGGAHPVPSPTLIPRTLTCPMVQPMPCTENPTRHTDTNLSVWATCKTKKRSNICTNKPNAAGYMASATISR